MGSRDTVGVPVMDLAIGQVYGEKYRIVRLLGQGSMGAVYEGENVRIHRKVAIKTLHQGMAEKGDTLQRFEREAQAAGRIGSKHICEVLDMGDLPDGSRYMVMEHLDGVTLQQHIRSSGRLRPQEASPIVQQLLDGLGAAHQAGIIHRDLKPANVFLVRQPGRGDFVKILDFGVSKFSVLSEEMSMTRTGAVLGTPYYMSPEQAKGSRGTDARSDLYAVGVILYECITGQVPFSAETFNELLFRIVLESPPPAESFVPDLSPEFAAIIRKAMAREPVDRYQTAQEFKQVLAEWSAKNDDGLSDAQTVMRTAPSALRAAPPSLTAQGTVLVDRAPSPQAAKSGLAAQGTVIIDPAVAGPSAGTPPPPAAGAPAQGNRYTGPTQPIPMWTGPTPPGIPGPAPVPTLQSPQGQAYPNAMPQAQPYPQAPADPYASPGTGPYAFAQGPDSMAASQIAPKKSPMRMIAFLGIAVGLLAGVAVWAVLWRDGGGASEQGGAQGSIATATATTASAAPSTTDAPATASTAEPAGTTEPTGTAAPSTSASAAPAPTVADAPPGSTPSSGATGSKGGAKAAGSSSAGAKSGGKNPKGGRTVSSDL